jgi:selenocysteine-specific elongation factor
MEPPVSDFQLLPPDQATALDPQDVFNVNVGIMGHVDSGKTSFCRFISQVASTASLDKNPQSKERGITLDIGFTSFYAKIGPTLAKELGIDKHIVQFTLVDCPGHASFIKSVIAGASIIDSMILVIDAKKGIQVQTAECLALGELMHLPLTVVLSKVDLFTSEELADQNGAFLKLQKQLIALISKTRFPNRSNFRFVKHSIAFSEEEK